MSTSNKLRYFWAVPLLAITVPLWIVSLPYLLIMRYFWRARAQLNLFGKHEGIH